MKRREEKREERDASRCKVAESQKSPEFENVTPHFHFLFFHFLSSLLFTSSPPLPPSLPFTIDLSSLLDTVGHQLLLPGESLSLGSATAVSTCRVDQPADQTSGPAIRGSPANLPHLDSFISWLTHRDWHCLLSTSSDSRSSTAVEDSVDILQPPRLLPDPPPSPLDSRRHFRARFGGSGGNSFAPTCPTALSTFSSTNAAVASPHRRHRNRQAVFSRTSTSPAPQIIIGGR